MTKINGIVVECVVNILRYSIHDIRNDSVCTEHLHVTCCRKMSICSFNINIVPHTRIEQRCAMTSLFSNLNGVVVFYSVSTLPTQAEVAVEKQACVTKMFKICTHNSSMILHKCLLKPTDQHFIYNTSWEHIPKSIVVRYFLGNNSTKQIKHGMLT